MRFEKAFIPYGGYWSTPFCKWQGSLAGVHAIELAAAAARTAMAQRDIPASGLDGVVLGMTVPQKSAMYGAPWLAALIGAEGISGPTISQACATGARCLAAAATEIENAEDGTWLSATTDRCSNGPHVYYPDPKGPGGTGKHENWVTDSFARDPWARNSMTQTAENVAAEQGISREEQEQTTLIRYGQYQDALADDAAFQKRYMLRPFELAGFGGRKGKITVEGDEGVFPTTAEGLARLQPVVPGGTVTYGSQTHPADGACGVIVASRERARSLSRDPQVEVRLLAYGQARAEKGFMAKATVPAARAAMQSAGLTLEQIDAIKTHNPFAVNDIYLARELGIPIESFNRYGSSLIYGHPQGPTGTRLIVETIEELAQRGGGHGLFVGCAAGDTAAAVVIAVS